MLSVGYRPRQESFMQTGGSFVTRQLRLHKSWNILIVSFLLLHVLQQDTEPYTAMIYGVWMLHIADFYDQWWGLLATWHEKRYIWNERVRGFTSQTASKVMVGNVFTTPSESGTIFRNITRASLDQEGYGLASRRA